MGQLKKHLVNVVNKTWNAAGRCKTAEDHLYNATFGLVGEAGEVADTIKKMQFHKPKDKEAIRHDLLLEMGDVMYYFLKLKEIFGFTLEEILEANKSKLFERHGIKE